MLVGATSGSLATLLLGYLGDKYDIKSDPEALGYILGSAVLISYIGCIPFFLLNAEEYAKVLKYQALIQYYAGKEEEDGAQSVI